MQKKSVSILFHCMAWGVILAIVSLLSIHPEESFSIRESVPFTLTLIYLIGFFYLNAYLLTIKLIPQQKFLYITVILLFLFLYIMYHHIIFVRFRELGFLTPPPLAMKAHASFRNTGFSVMRTVIPSIQFIFFWVISSCYRLALEWLATNRRNKEIEAEKSIIELAYLKAQINPHFFFNTLNTIYSLTLNKNRHATEAILLFSQSVRYVLDKIDTNFVSLAEEIDYITQYIELQELRFTDSLTVEFETTGQLENHRIAPLIFISFVENAFQYGVSNHYPSTITIQMNATDDRISFMIWNKKYKKNEGKHAGKNIGITNAKRKLNLMYPEKHTLLISDTDDTFSVNLTISDTYVGQTCN